MRDAENGRSREPGRAGGESRAQGGRAQGENPGGRQRFADRRSCGEKHGERRAQGGGAQETDRGGYRGAPRSSRAGDVAHSQHSHGGVRADGYRSGGENRSARRFEDRHAGNERRFGGQKSGCPAKGRADEPKTARDVALTALGDVVRSGAYASQALDRALEGARLSPEDRRLAAGLFYTAVENRLRLDWTLGRLMETRPEPVVADILHIAAAQLLFMDRIPDHAAVDEAVKQVRRAGRGGLDGLVNGVLRSLIRARDAGELALPDREADPETWLSVRCSLAAPAVKRLVAAYGMDMAEQIAAYSPKERTQTVRPNLSKIDHAAFEAMLEGEGLQWRRGMVTDAYILDGAGNLAGHDGYRAGMFSIQGESSMLAAQAVGAKPGMQILDACAAPGGKTCLMAEQMKGSGRVFAWDVHPHRVELIRAAMRRLSLENVRPAVHDARRVMESMELAMDAVLVDAPCSGLGVMADKPDIRFRVTEEELESLVPLQAQILDACARMVKVGGRLVYSTCTILPAENEEQVRSFLTRHPEFELETDEAWLPEALRESMRGGMLQLLPSRDGVEGFFIARMRRRSM